MCGIAGIVGGAPRRDELQAMLTAIRHRGPDGEGSFLAEGIALGNVRLAIVDPTPTGAQPMQSPDGRYSLVYNGELYNHLEFRTDLEASGVHFRGRSDTETLLWLLIREGESVLPRLNGIFAFAFHDAVSQRTLLVRDQLGVKPLYLARGREGRLLFGSEIKAVLATGEVSARMNVEDALELFMFHFIAGERTAFRDVHELLPGHLLDLRDGHSTVRQYWSIQTAARCGAAPDSGPERLRELLTSAVRRQLMSDVPVGVMSSGGVDSGVVTALSGQAASHLTGFCFRDPSHGYDELASASATAGRFGVTVREVTLASDELPSLLEHMTLHYDEPIPRPHHLAAFAVARAARTAGIKVLLSGEGGDELFGGYQRYADFAVELAKNADEAPLVFAHNRIAIPRIAPFLEATEFRNNFRARAAEETRGLDVVNRQLLVDQQTFLQHFLQRSDRMGLAAGVEIRVPLLDIPLVEHINGQPGSTKIVGTSLKHSLRSVARPLVGDIVDRPKLPFDLPVVEMMRTGSLAQMLGDYLLARPRIGDFLDRDAVRSQVMAFQAGDDALWKVVWMLLTTELWARTFRVTA